LNTRQAVIDIKIKYKVLDFSIFSRYITKRVPRMGQENRRKVKAITSKAYLSLFLNNFWIKSISDENLRNFKDIDAEFYMINAVELDVSIAFNIVRFGIQNMLSIQI
jgi:ATP-dependent phosphoenolpyruvate carboxykinase